MERLKREEQEKEKALVAVLFQNGLGNFIMMTPAIQALAEMYEAKVDIVLDDSWKDSRRASVIEFCEQWPLINDVIEFENGLDAKKYVRLFYSYHGEKSSAFNFFEKNAGYEGAHINWRAEKLHEVDFYMNDVFNLGYKGPVPKQHCISGGGSGLGRVNYGHEEHLKIGFCNGFFAGSKWKWERKGWPHFPELAESLRKFFDKGKLKIILFGKGKVEAEWADTIKAEGKTIFDIVDRTAIGGTIQVLRKCDLFITTDTGLMHLADAIGVPTIALFGPTVASKNGPYNREHRIARSPLQCAPCQGTHLFHSCEENRCMKELTAGMIMSVIREYIVDLVARGKLGISSEQPHNLKPCLLRW